MFNNIDPNYRPLLRDDTRSCSNGQRPTFIVSFFLGFAVFKTNRYLGDPTSDVSHNVSRENCAKKSVAERDFVSQINWNVLVALYFPIYMRERSWIGLNNFHSFPAELVFTSVTKKFQNCVM